MNKNIVKCIFLVAAFFYGIANAQQSYSSQLKDGLEAIEYCENAETTLERKKRKENAINRYYLFRGSVYDVETERDIEVKLSSGHYANVRLIDPIGSSLRKDEVIKIKGALTFIGSGILIKHDIKDARIIPD